MCNSVLLDVFDEKAIAACNGMKFRMASGTMKSFFVFDMLSYVTESYHPAPQPTKLPNPHSLSQV